MLLLSVDTSFLDFDDSSSNSELSSCHHDFHNRILDIAHVFFIFEILRMVAGHGVDKTDEIMETLRFQSFSERTLDDIL